MKKMILATAAVAAFGLSAGVSATSCAVGSLCSVTGATANYIQDSFNLQLSSGVTLDYVQSANAVGVGTFHAKGNSGFAGISNGGQIIPCKFPAGAAAVTMPTVTSSGSGASDC
jgi:uncharacterized protein YycO